MCSKNLRVLNLECNGEIFNIVVTKADFNRANTDLLFAQELLERHINPSTIPNEVSESSISSVLPNEENKENLDVSLKSSSGSSSTESWSEAETLLLISLYDSRKEDFSHAKKRKHVWTLISEEMMAHNYFREVDKLERKWTNLMRVYRAIKDNKGPHRSGRGAQNYKFFEKLEEVLGDKPSNNPTSSSVLEVGVKSNILPARDDITPTADTESNDDVDSATDTSITAENSCSTSKIKRRKETASVVMKKQQMAQKEARHKELVDLEHKRLTMEEKKIELLQKYLEKLSEKKIVLF